MKRPSDPTLWFPPVAHILFVFVYTYIHTKCSALYTFFHSGFCLKFITNLDFQTGNRVLHWVVHNTTATSLFSNLNVVDSHNLVVRQFILEMYYVILSFFLPYIKAEEMNEDYTVTNRMQLGEHQKKSCRYNKRNSIIGEDIKKYI
jgi:hypothetical protein